MQQQTVNIAVVTIAGSNAAAGKVRVFLAGYGANIPEIVGNAVLGQVQNDYPVPANGQLTIALWGNDVISPAGTYYCVQILDPKGNVIAANNYLIAGVGGLDLTALLPYNPSLSQGILYAATLNNQGPPGPPGGVAGLFSGRVVPAGTIDGNNAVFTVPGNPGTLWLFKNGIKMDESGGDYTWVYTSANLTTITFKPSSIPQPANQANGTAADNLEFYGYSSANIETTVEGLVQPVVAAAVQTAVTTTLDADVSAAVAAALAQQIPAAVTAALVAAGVLAQPGSLAITGTDGVVYLIQSVANQLQIVAAGTGVNGAPSSYAIADTLNGNTYLITVGAGGQFNDPQQTNGVNGAPAFYNLPDPNGKTNKLQIVDGQYTLTLGS